MDDMIQSPGHGPSQSTDLSATIAEAVNRITDAVARASNMLSQEPLPPQVTSVEGDGYHSDSDSSVYGINTISGNSGDRLFGAQSDPEDGDNDEDTDYLFEVEDAKNDDDTLTMAYPVPVQAPQRSTVAAAVSNLPLTFNSPHTPSPGQNANPGTKNGSRPRTSYGTPISRAPRANSWSSFNPHDNPEVAARMIPPMAFTLFPQLAVELRCKIWHWAAQQPRIIEIESTPAPTDQKLRYRLHAIHTVSRVCPRSRMAPSLLSANKESRYEALKYYQKETFDSLSTNWSKRFIYFNPKVDVVYFGEAICWATISRVFMSVAWNGTEIPRVALDVAKRCNTADCPHDNLLQRYNSTTMPITMCGMEVLHGFRTGYINVAGCPGLKEVLFVLKSGHDEIKHGELDASFEVHPATMKGINEQQQLLKTNFEVEIENLETSGIVPGVSGRYYNKWSEERPRFQFVSFHRMENRDMRIHSAVSVKHDAIAKLEKNDWEFLKRLECRTACKIAIPEKSFPRKRQVEIKLFGTKENIEKAVKAIVEKAMTYAEWQQRCKNMVMEPARDGADGEAIVEATEEKSE